MFSPLVGPRPLAGLLNAGDNVSSVRESVLVSRIVVAASVYNLAAADDSVKVIIGLQISVHLRAGVRPSRLACFVFDFNNAT